MYAASFQRLLGACGYVNALCLLSDCKLLKGAMHFAQPNIHLLYFLAWSFAHNSHLVNIENN